MYVGKKHAIKANYRIKLLSGNSVILVEAEGFDSELFMPHIHNGRIDLQNILPSRRCPHFVDHPKQHKQQRLNTESSNGQPPVPPVNSPTNMTACPNTCIPYTYTTMKRVDRTPRSWRMSAGQDTQFPRTNPIANSTPAAACNNNNCNNANCTHKNNNSNNCGNNKENLPPNTSYNNTHETASPQPVRSSMPHGQHNVLEMMKDTYVQIPNGVKVIRLFGDHTTPDGHTVSTSAQSTAGNTSYTGLASISGNGTSRNVSISSPTRTAGQSPNTRMSHHRSTRTSKSPLRSPLYTSYRCSLGNSTVRRSPSPGKLSIHLPNTPRISLRRSPHKSTLMCPTQSTLQKIITPKWRKCLTPKYNYLRNAATSVSSGMMHQRSNISINRSRNKKVVPSYLLNPTQGIKGTHKIELRKRKLIVDTKKTISPQSFKRQQRNSPINAATIVTGNKKHSPSYDNAFDMLTQSTRAHAMSAKLNKQFQKGCINKACSTNPKYKTLCTLPSESDDDEIDEFVRRQKNDRAKFNCNQGNSDRNQAKGVTFYNSSMGDKRHTHYT